jgi:hypothetical protein
MRVLSSQRPYLLIISHFQLGFNIGISGQHVHLNMVHACQVRCLLAIHVGLTTPPNVSTSFLHLCPLLTPVHLHKAAWGPFKKMSISHSQRLLVRKGLVSSDRKQSQLRWRQKGHWLAQASGKPKGTYLRQAQMHLHHVLKWSCGDTVVFSLVCTPRSQAVSS